MKLTIKNMNCGGCASSITKAIKSVDAYATVLPDVSNRTITVETLSSEADIRAVLETVGYPATEKPV